jgi:hypothetical protein
MRGRSAEGIQAFNPYIKMAKRMPGSQEDKVVLIEFSQDGEFFVVKVGDVLCTNRSFRLAMNEALEIFPKEEDIES